MFICRYFIFNLQESSKYLLAKGQDEEAIAKNGRTITLTLEKLQAISGETTPVPLSSAQLFRRALRGTSLYRRLAVNSTITIWLGGKVSRTAGIHHSVSSGLGVNGTYRNYSIISVLAIPGSLIACWMVDWTRKGRFSFGGRKFAMSTFTALTGILAGVLEYACVTSLTQNAMYGVVTMPEVFPVPHRSCIWTASTVFFSLVNIAVATCGDLNTSVPVFVAASLFLVAASIKLMFLSPIEASFSIVSL
ncbi:hypothetical protein JB92DRAFT_2928186 [Gautieria morchelliformis]|nr:hypothetical protein JB92DRAFT_2928186 [Gautieria morchelliformis]